jgi:hypothetical protein
MKSLFSLCFLSCLIISCKKDKVQTPTIAPEPIETLEIRVQPYYNGAVMKLDSIYTDAAGYKFKWSDFLFYLTQLKNGSSTLANVALFDYRNTGTLALSVAGKSSDFTDLTFNIGVDSITNHGDPSTYDNASPLNIITSGQMFWGWNPGYIFINLEGKVDTLVDATNLYDLSMSYHIGNDVNRRIKTLTNINWQGTGMTKTLYLKIDVNEIINGAGGTEITVNNEYFTHSAPSSSVLTNKFITNFLYAFKVQ